MAILATQTIVGSIGRVYDLREVGNEGRKVIDFSVAVTPRKKVDGEWSDGTTYWVTVTAWNRLAENIAQSFKSGDRVFVVGRTDMKEGYTNKDGNEIPARPIVIADFAGLDVSSHPAKSLRPARGEGGGYNGGGNNDRQESRPARQESKPAPKDDDLDFSVGDDDDFPVF